MLETDIYRRVDGQGVVFSAREKANLAVSFLDEAGRLAWLHLVSVEPLEDQWHVLDPLQGRTHVLSLGPCEVVVRPKPFLRPEIPCIGFFCDVGGPQIQVLDPDEGGLSLYACVKAATDPFREAMQIHIDPRSSEFPALARLAEANELIRSKVEEALQGTPIKIRGKGVKPRYA